MVVAAKVGANGLRPWLMSSGTVLQEIMCCNGSVRYKSGPINNGGATLLVIMGLRACGATVAAPGAQIQMLRAGQRLAATQLKPFDDGR